MFFSLQGKVAVITGGTSGIGLATAKRFAAAGAKVVIAARREVPDLARQLGVLFVGTDVAEEAQVRRLMDEVAAAHGRIDVCINNAGVFIDAKPIDATETEHMLTSYHVNTLGALYGMKYAGRHMSRGGVMINVSSLAGLTGIGGYADYVASKFALVGLTKVAAIEYGPRGIRVNCVCPSTVDTPMLHTAQVGAAEAILATTASTLDTIATVEDLAALMHFLAADDCRTVSGQSLVIDAGMSSGYSDALCETVVAAAGQA